MRGIKIMSEITIVPRGRRKRKMYLFLKSATESLFALFGFWKIAVAVAGIYLAIALIVFVAGLFSPKIAKADKTWCLVLLLLTVITELLAAIYRTAKTGSLFPVTDKVHAIAAATGLFLDVCVCILLFLRQFVLETLSPKEKRIVTKLIREGTDADPAEEVLRPSVIPRAFSASGCVRRIEKIQTYKPINDLSDGIDRLNYNKIAFYIERLRQYNLSIYEKDELDKLSVDIRKYSARTPSDFERAAFGDRLLTLVKILAKYDVA